MKTLICPTLLLAFASTLFGAEDPLATPAMKPFAKGVVELGWRYLKQGDAETAMRRFQMGIRHDKGYAPAYYGVGYTFSLQGKLEEAVSYYKETIERDRKHLYAHANMGYALLQLGKEKEALQALDTALEIDPKCGEAHLTYGNYYASHQKWTEAGRSTNKAIALGQRVHPEFREQLETNGVVLSKPSRAEGEQDGS